MAVQCSQYIGFFCFNFSTCFPMCFRPPNVFRNWKFNFWFRAPRHFVLWTLMAIWQKNNLFANQNSPCQVGCTRGALKKSAAYCWRDVKACGTESWMLNLKQANPLILDPCWRPQSIFWRPNAKKNALPSGLQLWSILDFWSIWDGMNLGRFLMNFGNQNRSRFFNVKRKSWKLLKILLCRGEIYILELPHKTE